jgi:hypothetical protein
MQRKSNTPRSHRRATSGYAFELPSDRAFVLHLDTRAKAPRRLIGRIEHVTSGRVAHVTSLRELLAFVADVLRPHSMC